MTKNEDVAPKGCPHSCQDCLDQKKKVVGLVMELDSFLSLLRHRHINPKTPDDLLRDVDRVLGHAHGFAKSGRMA